MNYRSFSCLSLIAAVALMGQTFYDTSAAPRPATNRNRTAAEFRLLTTEHILQSGSPLKIGDVQLRRMGDEVAVNLIELRATNGRWSAKETTTALEMLEKAFDRPQAIVSPADRAPQATVRLLQDLRTSPEGSVSQQRIGLLLRRYKSRLK